MKSVFIAGCVAAVLGVGYFSSIESSRNAYVKGCVEGTIVTTQNLVQGLIGLPVPPPTPEDIEKLTKYCVEIQKQSK